jgi:S-DNA-T family DNA segregation ATPase FtsK/SpoIIIE
MEAEARLDANWFWRYRRHWAPFGAAVALVMVAAGGHPFASKSWPWVIVVCGAGTVVWVLWKASRPVERLYGAAVGALVAVLTAIGWAVDVGHAWYLLTVLVATVASGVPWWRHQLPRGKVKAPWGRRRRYKRNLKAWPEIAEARGLGGVRLQRIEADEHGWSMWLRIPAVSKLTAADVVAAIDGLETAFQTRVGAARVEREPNRADRCMVRFNVTDPLSEPIAYPGPSGESIAVPVRLGVFEDRSSLRLAIVNQHWLIAGAVGSGKSVLQRVLLAELLLRVDVVVWAVDVAKHGVQFGPFRAALHRLATDPSDAVAMLGAALAIHGRRAGWMAAEGLTEWPLSVENPQLVIVLDEVSDLLTVSDVPELLEALVKLGREQGITVIAATQRASADALGDSVVTRTQMSVRVALRCNERADGDLILGQGRAAEGWRPDRLPGKGALLVRSDDHQTPRPARSYLLEASDARELSERPDAGRGRLDAISTAADEDAESHERAQHRAPSWSPPLPPPAERRGRRRQRTAEDRVLALLQEAGEQGITTDRLVDALRPSLSRASLFRALDRLTEAGRAEQARHGVWRAQMEERS